MEQLQQTGAASQLFVGGSSGDLKKELPDHLGESGSVASVHISYDRRRRGFGPTQAQHSGSISRAASVSFLDILRQVLTLPETLDPDSKKALSATCKICRLQFIAQVQVVTVVRADDYTLVLERRWPRLCMVILQNQQPLRAVSLHSRTVTRFVELTTSARDRSRAAVSMLRPLHQPATDLPWTHVAAQQLAHQMKSRWPLMHSFRMSHVHDPDGLGFEIVSQLVKGTWTQLVDLYLSDCNLKAEGFFILSQGNWPGLMYLGVSGNCLDAEGMALLVKGNWPCLTSITLSFDATVDAVAIAHLSAANWPIEELTIEYTPFSVDTAAELADLRLPNLSVLHLVGSGLMAAAVSELARADWPSLENLCIGHDDLDAVAVLLGVDLESSQLQELKYDASFAVSEQRMPDVVLWPNLSWISISKGDVALSLDRYELESLLPASQSI